MKKWFSLVVLGLGALTAGPAPTVTAHGQDCVAWDREQFGEAPNVRPAIDRLTPDVSFDELLTAWRANSCLRLNQVQVIGTHNSYHVRPAPALLAAISSVDPNAAISFDYTHRPLDDQFGRLQVRQIELDIFDDPVGGLFSTPIGGLPDFGGTEPLPLVGMLKPGLKVLHVQDIDYRTTCQTFKGCLSVIKRWSDGHPLHLPVMVLVEAKDDPLVLPISTPWPPATPVPFGSSALDQIDAEIRAVFHARDLMTPDNVRGGRTTLEEAVLKDGWPTLNELRGRLFFALDNTDQKRTDYISGSPSLAGRVMFTNSEPGTPEAAFIERNDPVADYASIRKLVRKGYLVRTRADADTVEARLGVTVRRDAALASGAQFVSTDYPEPGTTTLPPPAPGLLPYKVDISGPGRCNPVSAPPGCDSRKLE
jgi:hypothetical protein